MLYDIHTVYNCCVETFKYSTMISTSHLSFKLLYLNLMMKIKHRGSFLCMFAYIDLLSNS